MIKMYTCCRRRDRGGTVCPSTLRREVASIDGAVLDWVRDNVLTEEYATEVIAEAHRRIEEQNSTRAGDNEQFERLAKKLRAEIDKFAEMTLEAPDETRAVFFAKVSERQKQLADIEAKMHAVNTRSAAKGVDFHEMEREAREQLQNVAELFEEHPTEMRALVKALFPEGLKVTHSNGPTGNGTRMDGNAAHKGLKILA